MNAKADPKPVLLRAATRDALKFVCTQCNTWHGAVIHTGRTFVLDRGRVQEQLCEFCYVKRHPDGPFPWMDE